MLTQSVLGQRMRPEIALDLRSQLAIAWLAWIQLQLVCFFFMHTRFFWGGGRSKQCPQARATLWGDAHQYKKKNSLYLEEECRRGARRCPQARAALWGHVQHQETDLGQDCPHHSRHALQSPLVIYTCIRNLSVSASNKQRIASLGGIPPLIALLSSPHEEISLV